MIYNFPLHKVMIVDPVITIQRVTDDFIQKSCSVNVLLSSTGNQYVVILLGFKYETTWNDIDISDFVQNELVKYQVTE